MYVDERFLLSFFFWDDGGWSLRLVLYPFSLMLVSSFRSLSGFRLPLFWLTHLHGVFLPYTCLHSHFHSSNPSPFPIPKPILGSFSCHEIIGPFPSLWSLPVDALIGDFNITGFAMDAAFSDVVISLVFKV